jgi:hypothetical protein
MKLHWLLIFLGSILIYHYWIQAIDIESFVGSGQFPTSHSSLLLDSIFKRDTSGEFQTYKSQDKFKPKTGLGNYKQITNNIKTTSPCGGTDTNPNMCLYEKPIKSIDTEEKIVKCPKIGGNRVGWFQLDGVFSVSSLKD